MNIFSENFLGIPTSEFRFLGTEFKTTTTKHATPQHTLYTHSAQQQILLEVYMYIPLILLNGIVTNKKQILGDHFSKNCFQASCLSGSD